MSPCNWDKPEIDSDKLMHIWDAPEHLLRKLLQKMLKK